ncbi:copper resistance protein NlpE [Chryseobacterium sp. A321]
MKKPIILSAAFLLFLGSCQKKQTETTTNPADTITIASLEDSTSAQEIPTGDTTQNSLDWQGTYKGTLPCASCSGIETTLTLNMDGKYTLNQVYEGADPKDGAEFKEEGTFQFSKDGSYISLKANEKDNTPTPSVYFVAEGHLFQVTQVGDRTFNPQYKLMKK